MFAFVPNFILVISQKKKKIYSRRNSCMTIKRLNIKTSTPQPLSIISGFTHRHQLHHHDHELYLLLGLCGFNYKGTKELYIRDNTSIARWQSHTHSSDQPIHTLYYMWKYFSLGIYHRHHINHQEKGMPQSV